MNSLVRAFSYSAELAEVDGLRSSFGRLCCAAVVKRRTVVHCASIVNMLRPAQQQLQLNSSLASSLPMVDEMMKTMIYERASGKKRGVEQ